MKTKKTIIADIDAKTRVETTRFYNAVYETPKGQENGKNYLTPKAAQKEAHVYCRALNYKLLYIDNNLLYLQ